MRRLILLFVLFAVVLAACGDDKSGSESEREREGEKARSNLPCPDMPAELGGDTGLPSQFPEVDGLTYTATRVAGPSTIVSGFAEADLEDAYEAYKDALDE